MTSNSLPHSLRDDDGYTLTRYIEGRERMYGPLRFTYRPLTIQQRARIIEEKKSLGEEKTAILFAKVFAAKIKQWDARRENGDALPLDAKSILELHPDVFIRLAGIVIYSSEGGDPDPNESDSESGEVGDWLDEGSDEQLVGESQKNSSTP